MIEKRQPTPPDSAETPAAQLQKLGWSFRPRYMDNDPDRPIIGVRLTNCAKIFDNAQTIQIFDQRTVTLQFGFLQEQSVSLTDDDGALFIDWLKATHPDLAAPMLAAVPAGDPTPGSSNTGLNTEKARLVEYLAHAFPERFGKGGHASQPGVDFYSEVLDLLYDTDRDDARRAALILAAENMAHDMYADCNATLRQAARATTPEAAAELQMDAYGRAIAAETARTYGRTIRARISPELRPPDPEFPEAIDPQTIPVTQNLRALNPFPLGHSRPRGIPPTSDSLATMPDKVKAGAMVGIIDPSHAKFRQMGEIKGADGKVIWVLVSGATAVEGFEPAQLMALA